MPDERYQSICRPGTYQDIWSRLGEPLWWDAQAVPRYDPFKPDALDRVHDEVALVEIRCAGGDAAWQASMSSDANDRFDNPWSEALSAQIEHGFLYWGGGPPGGHACGGGETMSVGVPRVIEFWRREATSWSSPTSWRRIRELERVLPENPDMGYVDAKAKQLIELGLAADLLLAEHRGCGTHAGEKQPSCAICLLGRALSRTRAELRDALDQAERTRRP